MASPNVLIFGIYLSILCYTYSFSNYGPFNTILKKVTQCKGPKRLDCATSTAKILNSTTLVYEVNVTEDAKDIQGNLFATSESQQTFKLQMKKLCDHPFWLPLMRKYIDIREDCVIPKGYYRIVIDAQNVTRQYYGGSFIYGKWTFKATYFNNIYNYLCTSVVIDLIPK